MNMLLTHANMLLTHANMKHEYAVDSCTKCIVMHSMTVIGCINPRCACAMNLHFCAFIFLLYIYIYMEVGDMMKGIQRRGIRLWGNHVVK